MRAAGAEQAGLPEPVRAAGARLDAERREGAGRLQAGWLREHGRGPDRAVGRPGRAGRPGPACRAIPNARATSRWSWRRIFPHRFYIELQRAGRPDDEAHVARRRAAGRAPQPAGRRHASGAVHRPRTTTRRTRRGSASPRAKSWATRAASQALHARAVLQVPGADGGSCSPTCRAALANTLEIAKRCNLVLELGKPQLPDFPTPPQRHADRANTSASPRTRG